MQEPRGGMKPQVHVKISQMSQTYPRPLFLWVSLDLGPSSLERKKKFFYKFFYRMKYFNKLNPFRVIISINNFY